MSICDKEKTKNQYVANIFVFQNYAVLFFCDIVQVLAITTFRVKNLKKQCYFGHNIVLKANFTIPLF